jgi:nucleotide-binding universal stress UspA family protein
LILKRWNHPPEEFGERSLRKVEMAPKIIISYDNTDNDRDALALGRLLGYSGADLSLAYVRHFPEEESEQEALERRHAEELLEQGARLTGAPDLKRHVVFNPSTGQGLLELATREGADVVVFGSDYRTTPGTVTPQQSAQRLMTGGPVAVAIAPADFRSRSAVRISHVGLLDEDGDEAAEETARSLASALDATVEDPDDVRVDLLVVGSRTGTPNGRVELSATAGYAIDTATSPVLVVPRGRPVQFIQPARATA